MPLRGFEAVSKRMIRLPWKESGLLRITEHVFRLRNEQREQLLFYWTQDGRKFLEYEEEMTANSLSAREWIALQFRQSSDAERVPRIGVLFGTEAIGPLDVSRQTVTSFSKLFAGELYRICPWAEPID